MAVTIVAFVAARIAVTEWVRPHLMAPMHWAVALNPLSTGFGRTTASGPDTLQPAPPSIPNGWIYSTDIVDRAGHALTQSFLASACPNLGSTAGSGAAHNGGAPTTQVPADVQSALQSCVAKVADTYHEVVTYQPAGRYWAFQWEETAIFVGLAVLLAGFCVWWVRRRLN